MQIPPSSQPPSLPTPNFNNPDAAVTAHVAGVAANAAANVAATAGISPSDPNALWYITLEALGDLSAMHMAMLHGNMALALQYANDLLTNCDGKGSQAQAIITGMKADFTISNGVVTAINQKNFNNDWMQPKDSVNPPFTQPAVGGIQQAYALISQMPQFAINSTNIMDVADFFLFLSDSMLCPTVAGSDNQFKWGGQTYDLSDYIWGNGSGGSANMSGPSWGGIYFQDLAPMIIGSAFYLKDSNGKGVSSSLTFYNDVSQFASLFPTQTDLTTAYQNVKIPDFTGYKEMLNKLNGMCSYYAPNSGDPLIFPCDLWINTFSSAPYNWPSSMIYNLFQDTTNPNGDTFGDSFDMTGFFNAVTGSFTDFTSNNPF